MTTEDLLTRSLHEVTEHTDYPTTSLATVARRAGAVRGRRRRTTALAAAAAVAVVVTPAALWLNRSPDTSSEPTVSPSTTSSSPTVSTSPPVMALDSLPRGPKPGVDYIDGDTYVGMGGGNVTAGLLRKATAVSLARGGLLVALRSTLPNGDLGDLQLHSDQGDQGLGCGANRFAISADRVESAYWVMDSCTAGSAGKLYTGTNNTMGEAGPTPVATPAGRVVQPVGFLPEGTVVNLTMSNGDAKEVWVYGPQGRTQVPGLTSAGGTDQSHGRVSGQAAGDPSTGMIVDDISKGGRVVGYYPHWTLGQFSPDGRYVVGVQQRDGQPDGYAIFDVATGDKVTDFGTTPLDGFAIQHVAWDVDDTVLAVVQDGRSSDDAIVRFDLHGHATLATEPKPAADPSFPVYRLATRP